MNTTVESAPAMARVAELDWTALTAGLDQEGFAVIPALLDPAECHTVRDLFDRDEPFRKTVNMARHNYGRGRYRYFDYPLPEPVGRLREALYPGLAAIANQWAERLGRPPDWPAHLDILLARCQGAGQARPTPLLLRYGTGDYNRLHQDLYGEIHFPLQVVIQLSAPGREFEGGELVLVEQRPRQQSRPMVVPVPQGAAAIIPVRERPEPGARGYRRVQMRHGVSQVRRGLRTTLGLIFHDAR